MIPRLLLLFWCFPSAIVGAAFLAYIALTGGHYAAPLAYGYAWRLSPRASRLFSWGASGWSGLSLPPFAFVTWPSPWSAVRHEAVHLEQGAIRGPLFLPLYAAHWCAGLLRHRSMRLAYERHPYEIAARRV